MAKQSCRKCLHHEEVFGEPAIDEEGKLNYRRGCFCGVAENFFNLEDQDLCWEGVPHYLSKFYVQPATALCPLYELLPQCQELDFVLTCASHPEQYDVYDEAGKEVGYLRLRWGEFRVDYPTCGGETLWRFAFPDQFKGEFEGEEERTLFMYRAKSLILGRILRDSLALP